MIKFRGGLGIEAAKWNDLVDAMQNRLNDLKSKQFVSPIDQDKIQEPHLMRTDCSSRGGADKVHEANEDGDLRMRPASNAQSVRIGNSANDCIKFYFNTSGTRKIQFVNNATEKVYINYSGWNGLT